MLAAVLWLGNVSFTVIDNENHVEAVADEADVVRGKNHQSDFQIDEFGKKEDGFEIHDTEYVNKTDGETENSVVVESAWLQALTSVGSHLRDI
ncbi:hypothetical protein Dsin_014126 [Dipteronia sinensis]|uniref:Uncharacterized protein n=1 Tax=Dipteronia sinensis TaxID=43782 RepID=A0AAE0ALB6_9ROSI|nr:hypothetical protein Dsin_014126 [Dipteronia sinensis]